MGVKARRLFTSKRPGRVNGAGGIANLPQDENSEALLGVVQAPDEGVSNAPLPDATDAVRESDGIGVVGEGVEVPADGVEREFTLDETSKGEDVSTSVDVDVNVTTVDYSSMTVIQLINELKRRDLPSSGTKAQLVERLIEADRL